MAGYFGGRVDMVVTFLITVRLSMPVVLVALAVVAIVGGSLQVVICVLGLLVGSLCCGNALFYTADQVYGLCCCSPGCRLLSFTGVDDSDA